MKKKILIILLALIIPICLLFSGCGTKADDYKANDSERFVIVERVQKNFRDSSGNPVDFFIMVDKETRIMYFMVSGNYYFDMETIVDKDGKPLLYEGEL